VTFEELSATQGTPANDTFASEAALAAAFAQSTPEPATALVEVADPTE